MSQKYSVTFTGQIKGQTIVRVVNVALERVTALMKDVASVCECVVPVWRHVRFVYPVHSRQDLHMSREHRVTAYCVTASRWYSQ